ncbi:low specificity L-threonine aldolase [Synechococcus sp. Nb3U1]|uniref:threonine aldolase family protein n=1 Tax=Synechococcus sp. Nb3U1 TaxID=1914529 RepID=UPI001F161AEC|nr:low specificity L-threonine aldolase [Synechococcus sp. Nb3U1]MCF2971101.1 low specificity L-threonine aldolase [Synechococcus sp. Nb3U1]
MNFCSDNVTGACPEVMQALMALNQGSAMPYGGDDCTAQLQGIFAEIFEHEVAVFPVATGSAANALALSVFTPPYGAIYCHPEAHINVDECGAPELFTGGAKLLGIPGEHGRIDLDQLRAALTHSGLGVVHHVQPTSLSLTQATEAGTVYSLDQIGSLAELAHAFGLNVHMDGARFANALVSLGCTPAEMTWKAGVDVLSFGATKNGAWAAEAVVFFQPELAGDFEFRRKRSGHLVSKMRFLSAQWQAYLKDGVWLRNARHANAMAQKLSEGLGSLPGAVWVHPPQANELFIELPEPVLQALERAGFRFYRWLGEDHNQIRLVTAFSTTEADVDYFCQVAHEASRVLSPATVTH